MASRCYPLLRLRRVRVTQLDECGRPIYTESPGEGVLPNHVVSNGVVRLAYEEDIEEGDEFIQKNGWGELCINDRANSYYKRNNVTIEFCDVDPELFSIVTGTDLILDSAGLAVGYRRLEGLLDSNFALEGWVGVPGVECGVTNLSYGYILFPLVTNATLEGVEFGNAVTTFTMTGFTRPGVGWGAGPYDVQPDGESPAGYGPLDPEVGPLEHYRKLLSDAPIPEATCGIPGEGEI